jgi:Domain of Unknown Function (DUF1206)
MSVLTATRRAARKAGNNSTFEAIVRAGLVGYGILHLAVAWLALQLATGHPATEGDQSGAFQVLAAQPLGRFLVWAVAVGLLAMACWQLLEAAVGHESERPRRRVIERVVSLLRTVVYAALAWTAYRVVSGAPASNVSQQQHATSGALGWPAGPWLVGLIGVAVAVTGLVIAGYGITKGFERRLTRSQMRRRTRTVAVATGQVGYAVKGLAYAIVGGLLVVAAATFDPGRSTGLDGALRTLAGQPFGETALLVVAFGFAVFGVFCFFQSRYRKI